MKCPNPIDAAVLADYWGATLPTVEDALEEHLLRCDECGTRLREIITLATGVRKLANEGSLRMVVSDEFLQRAAQEGLCIREYTLPAGGNVQCTVTAEDDLLIARLIADLSGVNRVDLAICDQHGNEMARMPDIPFHSDQTSITVQESMALAKAAPDNTMIMRLLTFDEAGLERSLGEYTFHHTRSLPGPGAW